MKKRTVLFFFLFSVLAKLSCQAPSVVEHIRIPLWAEIDAYPELEEAADIDSPEYSYTIKKIRELGPFLISGMTYGWKFTYTPSDKARHVEEYFEIEELMLSENEIQGITYSDPWFEDDRINCWCEYTRTPAQLQNYHLWSSINKPTIQGYGYGKISDGFDGIKAAAKDALKNAVRAHYRSKIKNKPKEIQGSVLIRGIPVIGVDAGKYTIKLDFFLEYGKIIEYKVF